MSSSQLKAKLKLSRDAISKKEWHVALDAANDVLALDEANYNAHIFKALSLQNLNDFDASEQAFREAIQLNPTSNLAWQGLEKLFGETRDAEKLRRTLREVMEVAKECDDAPRCAEALQKLLDLERSQGTKSEIAEALALHLPSSPYYPLLSALPPPDQSAPLSTPYFNVSLAIHVSSFQILQELVEIRQELEDRQIEKEVEKGRNRLENLGVAKEVLRDRVGVEIWSRSQLPELYDQLSSHPSATDSERREAESNLLRYHHRLLLALPLPPSKAESKLKKASTPQAPGGDEADAEAKRKRKAEMREKVAELAKGMTTIGVMDELAWRVRLEWIDAYSLVDLPMDLLRNFIHLFPRHALSSSFKALLSTIKDRTYRDERIEEANKMDVELQEEDALDLAINGVEGAPTSILAHRIASALYGLDNDWSSCIESCNASLNLVSNLSQDVDLDLSLSKLGIGVDLGVALTKHHAPQHHARALRLLYAELEHRPDDFEALLAKAHIVAFAERWEQARGDFQHVVDVLGEMEGKAEHVEHEATRLEALRALSVSRDPALEARGEMAWCLVKSGRFQEGRKELEEVIDEVDELDGEGEGLGQKEKAKAWWRLGSCLWEMGGELKTLPENAFTCYITALKRDSAYAPAFTSLGFYYESVASPTDPVRASKCFQKAFELDAGEHRAGFKLAQGFAEEQEWELVDVVARRTVEGEGGREALLGGSTASQRRHVTRNAWAWKAIGSLEVQKGRMESAIVALQICLRSTPDDAGAWQRLGEAYLASGRHTAAIKSFAKAGEMAKGGWEAAFSTALVHRQLSEFQEALHILEEIVEKHPEEEGVRLALAETRLEMGRAEVRDGTTLRAERSFSLAMHHINLTLTASSRGAEAEATSKGAKFKSAWKVAADAAFELSQLGRISDVTTTCGERVEEILRLSQRFDVDANLPFVKAVTRRDVQRASTSSSSASDADLSPTDAPKALLKLAIYLYKLRVELCASEEVLGGAAWADLAMGLYRLSQLHPSAEGESHSSPSSQKYSKDDIAKQAVGCLKEAIKLEPKNASLLLLLGNISFRSNLKLAQHCYIQAIEADRRSALPWASLGFLYLHHEDVELANEAFIKAQTLDPDQAYAWVGQALVARAHGDEDASRALFQHAVGLCEGAVLEADYGFASSVFKLFSDPRPPPVQQLHSPSFALSAYLSHLPSDATTLHLAALLAERLGEIERAEGLIKSASEILEKRYEEDEEAGTALRYALCQVNLGRILVAAGQDQEAVEVLEGCVGLIEGLMDEEGEGEGSLQVTTTTPLSFVRVNASLSLAVAQHKVGEYVKAIETMRGVLSSLQDEDEETVEIKGRVQVEMARILWATGEEDAREEAKNLLLECISSSPHNISAISSLATIGLVTSDTDLFEAALAEVESLEAERLKVLDPEGKVTTLLAASYQAKGEVEEARKVLDEAAEQRSWDVGARLRAAEAHVRHLVEVVELEEEGGEGDVEEVAKRTREVVQGAMNLVSSTVGIGAEDVSHALRLLAICQALAPLPVRSEEKEEEGSKIEDGKEENGNAIRAAPGSNGTAETSRAPSALSLAQQAIHVAPWQEENWAALDLARACLRAA